MEINREKYFKADGLCMAYSEQLSVCEKAIERLNNRYFCHVDVDQYNEYVAERDRLKAVLRALQEYKERLGFIDDKGVILVED